MAWSSFWNKMKKRIGLINLIWSLSFRLILICWSTARNTFTVTICIGIKRTAKWMKTKKTNWILAIFTGSQRLIQKIFQTPRLRRLRCLSKWIYGRRSIAWKEKGCMMSRMMKWRKRFMLISDYLDALIFVIVLNFFNLFSISKLDFGFIKKS